MEQVQYEFQITSLQSTESPHRTSKQYIELSQKLDQLKCKINNSPIIMLCCNQQCKQTPMICQKRKCQCKNIHKKCLNYFQIENFLDVYQRKIHKEKQLKTYIEKMFQKLIDQISLTRDKILEKVHYLYFSKSDLEFIQKIKNQDTSDLTGKLLSKCSSNLNYEAQISKQIHIQDNISQKMIKIQKVVMDHLNDLQINIIGQQKQSKQNQSNKSISTLSSKYWNSSILTSDQQVLTLQSFMPKRKFRQLKLLYRASENSYSTRKFWDNCINIPYTLVLVLTQHHKIIGGYTPLPWKKYTHSVQQKDPTGQSCIFSVTQGDKFELDNKQNAKYYFDQNWGPQFGKMSYADLSISDQCINSATSFFFYRMQYKNSKYGQNKGSYERFTGSQTQYFKIIQWQVFEVIF